MEKEKIVKKIRQYKALNTKVIFKEYKNFFDIVNKMEKHFKKNYKLYDEITFLTIAGMTCRLFMFHKNEFIEKDNFAFMNFIYNLCEENNWSVLNIQCSTIGNQKNKIYISDFKYLVESLRN